MRLIQTVEHFEMNGSGLKVNRSGSHDLFRLNFALIQFILKTYLMKFMSFENYYSKTVPNLNRFLYFKLIFFEL